MASIHHYLIILAVGKNQKDVVSELLRACTQCGCNILNSKIHALGQELSISLFVSGNWSAIAKMEASLPSLEQRFGLKLCVRRTAESIQTARAMAYSIQISAIDKEGILSGITDFFSRLGIPIEEVAAHTHASHTGTRIANLSLRINVPDKVHLASLREKFISYCDDHNLDAFLEPMKI